MASIATVYTAFMIYARRTQLYSWLVVILYAPGTALYIWARREQNAKVFKLADVAIFAVVILGAVAWVYALATGFIRI